MTERFARFSPHTPRDANSPWNAGRGALAVCLTVATGLLCVSAEAQQPAGNPLRGASSAAPSSVSDARQPTPFLAPVPQLNPHVLSQPPSADQPAADAPALASSPMSGAAPAQPVADEAKPAEQSAAPAAQRVSKKSVQSQIEELQNAQNIEEPVKAELLKRFKTALDSLTSAEEAVKRAAQYEAEIQQAPLLLEDAKKQLAAAASSPDATFPPQATLQQMEQLLAQAETRLKDATELLAKREEELKRRNDRKTELAKLVDDTKQRLEATRKQLSAPPPPNGESAAQTAARRADLEARLTAIESQLALYKVEARRHDALAELLPLQRDLAKRDKNQLEKEVAARQTAVALRREAESARQAQEARREAENAHPALRDLATRNAELAEQRKTVAEAITQISGELTALEDQLAGLERKFADAQEKTRQAGHSSTIGLMLRKQGAELPSIRHCEDRIRYVSRAMPEANLERIALEDERAALGDLQAAVAQALRDVTARRPIQYAGYLENTTRELLEKRRELLDQLVADYDTYLTELSELEVNQRKLVAQTSQFANYIDEHVLWIRSADMLRPHDAAQALQALASLGQPKPWLEIASSSGLDAAQHPLFVFLAAAALALLLTFHWRMRNRVQSFCQQTSGSATLRFWPTVEALFWNAVMAAEWPLVAWYLGWRMATAETSSELGYAVGQSLQYAALLCWLSEFIRRVCRPDGLAESHFNWSSYSLGVIRRRMRWLVPAGVPLAATVVFARTYQEGEWASSLGRLAFIAAMSLLAAFMHAILRSKDNVLRELIASRPDGWLAKLRFVCYIVAVGLPCALAVMAGVGYYYSAQELATRLQGTLALVLVLALSHALVSRWFLVKRRNLAIVQARQRQAENAPGDTSAGAAAPAVQKDKQDLSKLHEQLQYLLRHAVAAAVVIGGWMIWADVLPALRILDNRVLWWNTVEVPQTQEDANGDLVSQKVEKDVPTTLRHALFAGALLLATFILGRNLPALFEITVLQRLPFDKGARHAIAVVLRYTVALAGVVLACRTLSIKWSSVQWMAAGMTVGLGFGLQEIFANFVSGLILLFERPIRVGDVITLDDITGTVTNIHTRATTVRNWDRKELIVPNKELITGRLLNWTLSDSVNRIVITVGVAYKSDTRKARRLIVEAAEGHPDVLDDPPPNVTFESFGDSTLNFVLRCYVANMDVRLETIHELHEAIHDRFNEEGVEIAFPQRDLNIRSIDPLVASLAMTRERAPAETLEDRRSRKSA